MSERRVIRAHLYEAASNLQRAVNELRDAEEYMNVYPFLKEEFPHLQAGLESVAGQVEEINGDIVLWQAGV